MNEKTRPAQPKSEISASLIFRDGFSRHFDVQLFPDTGNLGVAPPTPKPVFEMLRRLSQIGALPAQVRRESGRALAIGPYEDARAQLDAFAAMGLGSLQLRETTDEQSTFFGQSLTEAELAGSGSCDVALGFCEGILTTQTGKPALGSETTCQRKGAPHCTFVVRTRGR